MRPNPQFPADLVTFNEEILIGNLIFYAVFIDTRQDSKHVSLMITQLYPFHT